MSGPPPDAPPAAPAVQGACPSGHRPFAAADGLLLRVRPPAGALTAGRAAALAGAADRAGAGPLELTRRANLQVRGVAPGRFVGLLDDLVGSGLVHPDPAVDERVAVLAAPAAGADPTEVADARPLAAAVLDRLAAGDGPRLHPKAGVLIDGGGAVSLRGHRYDVCLGFVRRRDTRAVAIELRLGGALPLDAAGGPALVVLPGAADDVALAALAVAAAPPTGAGGPVRVADLIDAVGLGGLVGRVERRTGATVERVPAALLSRASPQPGAPLGVRPQSRTGTVLVGAAPPLGRLDPRTLAAVAQAVERHSPGTIRLTPWRSLLVPDVPASRAGALATALGDLGLATDPADPALAVVACAGSGGCPAGLADTQADARRLVDRLRSGPPVPPARAGQADRGSPGGGTSPPARVHLSGCPKRCASRAVHAVTLVATGPGRYDALVADAGSPTGERLAARGVAVDEVTL